MEANLDNAMTDSSAGSGRYTVNAVASALMIFSKVVADGSTSLEGAADAAGVSRSTAYRLLATLTDLALLERIPGGGYMPGIEAFRWASRLVEHFDLAAVANPILEQLREECSESTNLALLQSSDLIYVAVFESPGVLRTVESVGSHVPLHAAAIGKAVAAFLEEPLLSRMIGGEPYHRFTSETLTTRAELDKELATVREQGYSVDLESVNTGVVCIAAPIFRNSRVAGAISLSGPRTRLTTSRLDDLALVVGEASAEISELLSPLTPIHLRTRQE